LTLWALANQDSFRLIGDRFGMLKGTSKVKNYISWLFKLHKALRIGDAHFIFLSTCIILKKNSLDFLQWPQRHELSGISEQFALTYTIGMQ
jgi:hypothetical protein